MNAIWQACRGPEHVGPLQTRALRIVESQEQVATMALVDSSEEQYLLEQLLEHTKPVAPPGAEAYHYLLWTPLRYPPLPYGSRLGPRHQAGVFYASLALATALAECAYYRFVFLSGLAVPLPNKRLTTKHTTFELQVETAYGVALEQAPFTSYTGAISDPWNYQASQLLGSAMREAGVEACSYVSARDPQAGANIAVFKLEAIKSRQPEQLRPWICTTTADTVDFTEVYTHQPPYQYALENFLLEGKLPIPSG